MTGKSSSLAGLSAIQALDYTVIRMRAMEAMRDFYGRIMRFHRPGQWERPARAAPHGPG